MKKLISAFFASILFIFSLQAQQKPSAKSDRPKIVVGLMVDQMRWDFLYRFQDRYGEGGFKRLLREGFNCDNAFIPYAQTVTACGHASVYTGSVPAINGIMGNEWYDRGLGRMVYCAEDGSVKTIGGTPNAAPMSPKNLLVTTVCDELRIATNFRSKVVGIAIKDRGGILTAGHSANAAYWYDAGSGNWVTSTYYMDELPRWVKTFNNRKMVDSLYKLNWNTLYPINTYVQSDEDDKIYEGKSGVDAKPVFPHILNSYMSSNYGMISGTPHGNTLTAEFAKAAIVGEGLGADDITDFLAISFSSPDYVGHQYGPNSIEIEDTYLRLDKELASLFSYLDAKFGNQYSVFITADHGVAQAPGYSKEKKLPGGVFNPGSSSGIQKTINKFGLRNLVESSANYQIYLNRRAIDSANLNYAEVKKYLVSELNRDPGIFYAFDYEDMGNVILPTEVKEKFVLGHNSKRAGDIQVITNSGYLSWGNTGSSHGTWYPYDSHIPMIFMGWGIKPGRLTKDVHMTDIAPTIAALLRRQMPSGSIGKVVSEALK
jgi:predicted AlkP superfamily pyrophosphatase or phosphodiesterase